MTIQRGPYNRRYPTDAETRVCRICKEELPVSSFNPNRTKANGYVSIESRCHDCKRTAKYGMTKAQYQQLLIDQKNACAICKTSFSETVKQHTDHCHSTNRVRGILCSECNQALGKFKDSIPALQSAITYLSHQ